MRAYIQLQMYCSSQDGLQSRKRLSTGVGDNGKSFLLDQDLETARCVTSAKKDNWDLIYSTAAVLSIAECFSLDLQIYFCFFLSSLFSSCQTPLSTSAALPGSPAGCAWLALCLHARVGEKDKAACACLCCCNGRSAWALCPARSGHSMSCSNKCHILGISMHSFPNQ